MRKNTPQVFKPVMKKPTTLTETNLNENQQKLKKSEDIVRQHVQELQQFIQQVQVSLQQKDISELDKLIQYSDNTPSRVNQTDNPQSEFLQVDMSLKKKSSQSRSSKRAQALQSLEKISPEKILNQHSTEELPKLIQSMNSLLEKNLQESQLLNKTIQSSFSKDHRVARTIENFENEEMNHIDEDEEVMSDNEQEMAQNQIQRLLVKIQEQNQKIQELQQQIMDLNENEEDLKSFMRKILCLSQLEYIETGVTYEEEDLQWETAFARVYGSLFQICEKINEERQAALLKSISISWIKDIFYPFTVSERIIAIVYQHEDSLSENQSEYTPVLLTTGNKQREFNDYKKNEPTIHQKLKVILLRFQTDEDFDKWDIMLWSLCKRALTINQRFIFENDLFERPFYDEYSVYDYKNPELDKLRDLIYNIISSRDPPLVQNTKRREFEKNKILFGKIVKEVIQQYDVVLPSPSQQNVQGNLNQLMYQSQIPNKQRTETQSIIQQQNLYQQTLQISNKTTKSVQQQPLRVTMITTPQNETQKLSKAIGILKSGFCFVKYSSKQAKPNQRVVYLSDNEKYLQWKEIMEPFQNVKSGDKKKKGDKTGPRMIDLNTIKSVLDRAEGPGFEKFKKLREGKEHLSITVIGGERNLEIEAINMEEKSLFIDCMSIALQNPQIK